MRRLHGYFTHIPAGARGEDCRCQCQHRKQPKRKALRSTRAHNEALNHVWLETCGLAKEHYRMDPTGIAYEGFAVTLSRGVKQVIGAVFAAVGLGLCVVFIWSDAWFGVMFGAFIGLFGLMALVYPDDAMPQTAKELTMRGAPEEDDTNKSA